MPGFNIVGNETNSDNALPNARTEVARANRWVVKVQGPGATTPHTTQFMQFAKSVSRPVFEVDKITMYHRSNEVYLPGKTKSGTCTLTIYESMDTVDHGAEAVRQWWSSWMMNAAKYSLNPSKWKQQVHISVTDGCGNQTWGYLLSGAFPLKVEPSELDYTQSELASISVTLSIDAFREGASV